MFSRARVAVFVDGDFWHGAGWRERGFTSLEEQFRNHRDPEKWIAKIRRNVERDVEVGEALSALGWRVIRVWESDVRSNTALPADVVERAVRNASAR